MSNFRQTSEALSDWQANIPYGIGGHIDPDIVSGVPANIVVGEVEFNPLRHEPYDIDHLSLMGAATGELYVPEVIPERPVAINIVVDATNRDEHPILTRGKNRLIRSLGIAVENALPGTSDQLTSYKITSEQTKRRTINENLIVASEPKQYAKNIKELAYRGLTFVITDGRSMQLPQSSLERMPVVGIKFNHSFERLIPANVGVIPMVGGGKEVDTSNSRELARTNAELEEEHRSIVEGLQHAGIPVAEVVTSKQAHGYNTLEADRSVARAVRSLAR